MIKKSRKFLSLLMALIMIISIITSTGVLSVATEEIDVSDISAESENASDVRYETTTDYPKSIDAFLNGTFYLDAVSVEGTTGTPLKLAKSKDAIEIVSQVSDKLKTSVYIKGDQTYLKLESGIKKNYLDTSELGVDMGNAMGSFDWSIEHDIDPVYTEFAHNGTVYDVYCFLNEDSSALYFYALNDKVVQITFIDSNSAVNGVFVVNELTADIPGNMLTTKGYAKTSVLFLPMLYPEMMDEEMNPVVIPDMEVIPPVDMTDVPTPEEPSYEEPAPEEPSYEEPAPEEPSYEEPAPEEPTTEEPTTEEPTTEEPTTEEPTTDEPTTQPDTAVLLGDVDGDGYTTSGDARRILRYSARLDAINDIYYGPAFDVTGDNKIVAADARLALRYSALFETAENVAPARTYLDAERYDNVKLKATYPSYSTGDEFTVRIRTENAVATENGNIFFTYDPTVLEFVNINESDMSTLDLAEGTNYEEGKISFAFLNKKAMMADTDLADITFRALSSEPSQLEYVIGTWDGSDAPYDGSFTINPSEGTTEPPTVDEPTTTTPETGNVIMPVLPDSYPAGSPALYFHVPENLAAGDTFNIVLSAANVQGVESADLVINYDAKQLDFVSIREAANANCTLAVGDKVEAGEITWSFLFYPDNSAVSFNVVVITFKALNTGTSDISVTKTSWDGTSDPADISAPVVINKEHITQAPETESTTKAPETEAPTTEPTTKVPETEAPTTEPTTKAPETEAPTTEPTTKEPETEAPKTETTTKEPEIEKPVSDKLEIKGDTVKVDNSTKITTIGLKNTSDDFAALIANENFAILDKDGNALKKDALVGTGSKIQIRDNKGTVINEYTVCVYNDVDGNGKVTAADARLALRGSAKLDIIDGVYALASDVTGDDKITAADARQILRVSAGLESA